MAPLSSDSVLSCAGAAERPPTACLSPLTSTATHRAPGGVGFKVVHAVLPTSTHRRARAALAQRTPDRVGTVAVGAESAEKSHSSLTVSTAVQRANADLVQLSGRAQAGVRSASTGCCSAQVHSRQPEAPRRSPCRQRSGHSSSEGQETGEGAGSARTRSCCCPVRHPPPAQVGQQAPASQLGQAHSLVHSVFWHCTRKSAPQEQLQRSRSGAGRSLGARVLGPEVAGRVHLAQLVAAAHAHGAALARRHLDAVAVRWEQGTGFGQSIR